MGALLAAGALTVVLCWEYLKTVTAGFYGKAFRPKQYLAAGVVASESVGALTYRVWRLRSGTVPKPYLGVGSQSQHDFANLS